MTTIGALLIGIFIGVALGFVLAAILTAAGTDKPQSP